MGPYEELLRKLGLLHLKDNPDKLQEAILRELGLTGLKGDPEAMNRQSGKILEEKIKEFESVKAELGDLILKHALRRLN